MPYRDDLVERANKLVTDNRTVQAEIAAFSLMALGAAETGDIEDLLAANLPPLFTQFPNGSLWLVSVSDALMARLAFGRTQLALQLTPDMPVGPDMEQLRAFSDLTLTRGVDFGAIMGVPLLALSPSALGFLTPALPHTLVFCFGDGVELRQRYPVSLASLYRPNVLSNAAGRDRSAFLSGGKPDDGARLLTWWVDRLNVIYSHATDPTCFTDEDGYYDAPAQTAWMVTVERVIGDALTLLAEPQATDLDRVQAAFDLLDKAEGLLGYGRKRSGKGFAALLRRGRSLSRLDEALHATLPADLADRLLAEATVLFDDLYAAVRDNTLSYRLTDGGARIATENGGETRQIDTETLVADLCRAVRNTSHGLLDILRTSDERFLLASNTGGIPVELPALAPILALGLFADVEGLIDGSWRTKLAGNRPS